MASHLTLECPLSHEIYFNLKEEGYSQPISGSVILRKHLDTEHAGVEQVRISLVRVVSSKPSRHRVHRSQSFSRQICRLLSSKEPPTSFEPAQSCSVVEELTLYVPCLASDSQVGYSPNEGKVYKIPFYPARCAQHTCKRRYGSGQYLMFPRHFCYHDRG